LLCGANYPLTNKQSAVSLNKWITNVFKSIKGTILSKLSQSGLSVRKFTTQQGINTSTLYSSQKLFDTSDLSVTKISSSDKWSSEEKFSVVLETATQLKVELSEYCRVKGLYPEQIKAWKLASIAGNTVTKQIKRVKTTPEQKSDKNSIKALENELHRKKP
jgi:transposase